MFPICSTIEIPCWRFSNNALFHKSFKYAKRWSLSEYINVSEELRYVRGQIDFTKYAQNWQRRHIISVNYNDRNQNNLINQTLKYAAFLASRNTKNTESFKRLKISENMLDNVEFVPITPQKIESFAFNRLNERFKMLVNIAKLFITYMSVKFAPGGQRVFSFFIPMEKLFEDFIARAIRDYVFPRCCKDAQVLVQSEIEKKYILKEKLFGMRPDIMIELEGGRYIIDTKYKLLNNEDRKIGVSQSDVYQMLAYTIAYNSKKTMLLYPKSLCDASNTWEFEVYKEDLKDRKLAVNSVDLASLKDGIDEFMSNEDGKLIKIISKLISVYS